MPANDHRVPAVVTSTHPEGVVAAQRARLAERDGRIALVLDVPVEICLACEQVWFTMDVAKRLDALFDRLFASGAETAQIYWEQSWAA